MNNLRTLPHPDLVKPGGAPADNLLPPGSLRKGSGSFRRPSSEQARGSLPAGDDVLLRQTLRDDFGAAPRPGALYMVLVSSYARMVEHRGV